MPAVLSVQLDRVVPGATPRQVLGEAASLCEAAEGDHGAALKPFTAGPVISAADAASWRLAWLADRGLPPGWPPSVIRFGPQECQVTGFSGHSRSYAELSRSGPSRRVTVRMTTPTFFSRNGRDLPVLEPILMVRGLLARWNAHAPEALRIAEEPAKALVASVFLDGIEGASRKVELGTGLRQVGFEGRAEVRLLKGATDNTAAVFGALARYAEFAGIGAQTTCGFGSVEVTVHGPAKPPARSR